jgi:phosphohistidine phosphatase
MRLAIVRHGKAEQHSGTGADRDRRLRPRGEEQARWLGERFAADGDWAPALILASPFERAITTARLIQDATGVPLAIARELECDEPASRAVALIARHSASPLMVVGHNPQLSRLVATLVGGPTTKPPELRTGEVALLEFNDAPAPGGASHIGCWRLERDDD